MSGWLDMLAPAAGGILRNILNADSNPNKVLEVRQDRYSHRVIRCREDAIVLYGPTDNKYEIVMNRPTTESMNKAFRFVHFALSLYICIYLLIVVHS